MVTEEGMVELATTVRTEAVLEPTRVQINDTCKIPCSPHLEVLHSCRSDSNFKFDENVEVQYRVHT